ncbi:acyltransferase family protein [Escherichia coli]|uniref:acyltransferase family protein n=1 Tax=Escherichia coli TaxID=562 RepID=UPI001F49BF7F|nr:acyltransferase family protein [Escherichia coli]
MIKYRADIDGLRAIAVLLVVLYHAKFPVPGGFIGVDVFFVISGFLITMIMDKEIREGRFTYSSFYTRRIKRLVPAFAFMLAILYVYCSYYLMPDDLLSFSKSAMLSLFGISNFYFFFNTNYFDSSVSEPLLHTWSLSVEEQFYIFWPFILMAIYKSKKSSVKATIFSVLFISSLLASQYYAINSKNMAYMMLPFRFFELMTGAIVAIKFRTLSQAICQYRATPFIGLALILASAFWLNDESIFPGFGALPACVGTAMLLSSGFNAGWCNRLLTCSPVVYVGKVSYSWYLWHWPFIILAVYRDIQLTTLNAMVLVICSFLMASVSYHFVEQPFRKAKISFPQAFGFIYALPVIVACVFLNAMYETSGLKYRVEGLFNELDKSNEAQIVRSECMDKMKVGNISECHLGVKKDKPDAIMIGDSFGNAYSGFVDVLAKNAGVMIHDTMRSATPSLPDAFATMVNNKFSDQVAKEVLDYNNKRTSYAINLKAVIIADYFDEYTEKNAMFRVYDKHWNDISNKTYEVRVMTPTY